MNFFGYRLFLKANTRLYLSPFKIIYDFVIAWICRYFIYFLRTRIGHNLWFHHLLTYFLISQFILLWQFRHNYFPFFRSFLWSLKSRQNFLLFLLFRRFKERYISTNKTLIKMASKSVYSSCQKHYIFITFEN